MGFELYDMSGTLIEPSQVGAYSLSIEDYSKVERELKVLTDRESSVCKQEHDF